MAGSALTRVHGVRERLDETLSANRNEIVALLSRIEAKGKGILQHHQLTAEVEAIPEANRKTLLDGPFGEVLRAAQEAIVLPPWVAMAVRPRPGVWEYIRVNVHALVSGRYTWQITSERLLTFTGVYGFRKHVSNLIGRESRRYLEMFYALVEMLYALIKMLYTLIEMLYALMKLLYALYTLMKLLYALYTLIEALMKLLYALYTLIVMLYALKHRKLAECVPLAVDN